MNVIRIKDTLSFICILVWVCSLCSCSTGHHYQRVNRAPDHTRLVILSKATKDRTLRPYVVNGTKFYPLSSSEGFVQTGLASWYGPKFHGNKTASGERYNMYKKTAAHKTLPLGTYVKVLNLDNGKQTVVRINDRGPFVKGRIIDLSYTAAKEIGLVGPGVAKVKVTALGKQVDTIKSPVGTKPVIEIPEMNRGLFTVQVGAFIRQENALKLADRLKVIFKNVDIEVNKIRSQTIYRVRVSRIKTLTKATRVEKRLEDMGFKQAFIVRL